MSKEVVFVPKSVEAEMLVPAPKPARNYLPDWYRNTKMFEGGTPLINKFGGTNATVRACMSFGDSFMMGYMQETWCDILVHNNGDSCEVVTSLHNPETITHRDQTTFKIPSEYYQSDLSWQIQWIPRLPDGYSMMYVHPMNRWDLPFQTVAGVVDNDTFNYEKVANYPFMIKRGFSGIIPKGTPFMQMIPFKRDEWNSSYEEHNPKNQILADRVHTKFWGGYKKLFWHRKVFN